MLQAMYFKPVYHRFQIQRILVTLKYLLSEVIAPYYLINDSFRITSCLANYLYLSFVAPTGHAL